MHRDAEHANGGPLVAVMPGAQPIDYTLDAIARGRDDAYSAGLLLGTAFSASLWRRALLDALDACDAATAIVAAREWTYHRGVLAVLLGVRVPL